MIVDHIQNAPRYFGVSTRVKEALEFLVKTDFSAVTENRTYEIDGKALYANCDTIVQRPLELGRLETHRLYGDIHYILEGRQQFGCAWKGGLTVKEAYDDQRDVEFYEERGDLLLLKPGMFIIVWPQDAHMPNIAPEPGETVKKVVVKFIC